MLKKITSLQHPLIKHLVKLRQNRDYRYEHQCVVIEGLKPIREVAKDVPIKLLLTYDESFVPRDMKIEEIFIVNQEIMQKASGMQSPEALLAEVSMPSFQSLDKKKFILALDGINDPGNLGSILRTALALGWEGVLLLNESCDPFNEKALRSARGATFRIPLQIGSFSELKKLIETNQLKAFVAGFNGTLISHIKTPLTKIILVLGNEAHGPSEEVKSLCETLTVPMLGDMESLNVSVAGGILMYALKRTNE